MLTYLRKALPAAPIGTDNIQGSLRAAIWLPLAASIVVIALFFGVFGAWAALAPLSGAASASGTINPDTNRKDIQHLEGGIISAVHIREGQSVKQGELLISLDDKQIQAKLQQRIYKKNTLLARIYRLLAERDAIGSRNYSDQLEDNYKLLQRFDIEFDYQELVFYEEQIYQSRKNSLQSKVSTLEQTIRKYNEEIALLIKQQEVLREHVAILDTEIATAKDLYTRKLDTLSRARALEKDQLSRKERIAQLDLDISVRKNGISNAKLEIESLWLATLDEVNNEIVDVRTELQSVEEEALAYRDQLRRIEIVAPVDGTVIGLDVHTVGGVIAPGETLLQIVPKDDRLIVDARVDPNDIDVVRVGNTARVSFLAYSARSTEMGSGKIISVSPDTLTSEDGTTYYLAKVEVDSSSVHGPDGGLARIAPGMKVEVLIVTESRTLLTYLLDPFIRSMRRSFIET